MTLTEIINEYLPSDGTKPTENRRMNMYENINTHIQNQNKAHLNDIVDCDSCNDSGEIPLKDLFHEKTK